MGLNFAKGHKRLRAAIAVCAMWTSLWWVGVILAASLAWLMFERNAPPPFPPMPYLTFLKMFGLLSLALGMLAGAIFAVILILDSRRLRQDPSDKHILVSGSVAGGIAGLIVGLGLSIGLPGGVALAALAAGMGWLSSGLAANRSSLRLTSGLGKAIRPRDD